MRRHRRLGRCAARFVACMTGIAVFAHTAGAQIESPLLDPELLVENLLWEWRAQQAALEQLRTQQQATLAAIELTRKEIATVSAHNMDSTLSRLDTMNEVLVAQRGHDLEFIRNSNRRVLTVVSSLTGLLFLTMLLVTVFSTRAMNRLTAALSSSSLAPPRLSAAPPAGLLADAGAAQLQGALERLEQRISELEHQAAQPTPLPTSQGKDHAA